MEWKLQTREAACFTLAAGHTSEERFTADSVVPDTLPDVDRLLTVLGTLCLWRLDLDEGSAELEGEIRCDVLYQDETGALQSFPVTMPVLQRFREDALSPGLRPALELRLTELTPQLMNARKVRLSARVRAVVQGYTPETQTLTEAVEAPEICQRRTRVSIEPVTAVEEQMFSAVGTAALRGAPERLMASRSTVELHETQCAGQRLILQGCVKTQLLYQAETLIFETVETPFSQLIDTLAAQELSTAEIQTHLTSVQLRLVPEEQAVEIEAHLVAQAVCRSRMEAEVLTDAYSNRTLLEVETETLTLPLPAEPEQQRVFAEAELPCDAGCTTAAAWSTLRSGDSAEAVILRRNADGGYSALRQELHFAPPEETVVRSAEPGELTVTPGADGLRLRLPIQLETARRETLTLTQITALRGEEANTAAAAMPALTLLRVGAEADLWEIAKRHASTVEAIRAANPEDAQRNYLAVPKMV